MNVLRGYKKDDEDCEFVAPWGHEMSVCMSVCSREQPLSSLGEEFRVAGGMEVSEGNTFLIV